MSTVKLKAFTGQLKGNLPRKRLIWTCLELARETHTRESSGVVCEQLQPRLSLVIVHEKQSQREIGASCRETGYRVTQPVR